MTPTEALAEAWASIDEMALAEATTAAWADGCVAEDGFRLSDHIRVAVKTYLDAVSPSEMITRLKARGYDVTAIEEKP